MSAMGLAASVPGLFGGVAPSGQEPSSVQTASLLRNAKPSDLPLTAAQIKDSFRPPRLVGNRTRTVDHTYKEFEATGWLRDFKIAAGKVQGKFAGPWWVDSDVYKWMEGASHARVLHSDVRLDARVDELIADITAAQQKDGYLGTYIQLVLPDLRWKNLAFSHALLCAGSLFEAAGGAWSSSALTSITLSISTME